MSDKSHTTSGTAKPAIASKSKSRSIDSNMLRTSSTRSGVVDSSGIGSFLGKAVGGSASLVDVGGLKVGDQASHPDEHPSLTLSKVTGAANRTTVLNDHGKHNSIAEVADLLKLDL